MGTIHPECNGTNPWTPNSRIKGEKEKARWIPTFPSFDLCLPRSEEASLTPTPASRMFFQVHGAQQPWAEPSVSVSQNQSSLGWIWSTIWSLRFKKKYPIYLRFCPQHEKNSTFPHVMLEHQCRAYNTVKRNQPLAAVFCFLEYSRVCCKMEKFSGPQAHWSLYI